MCSLLRPQVTNKSFAFAAKHSLPFFFVSASDGTNVVKIFHTAILAGLKWKLTPKDDFYQVSWLGGTATQFAEGFNTAHYHELGSWGGHLLRGSTQHIIMNWRVGVGIC